jgi:sugar O-acyltransferase (sialic acid O-acetyltransferase NeuD family)
MKRLILLGNGDWGLEVWAWLSDAVGYGSSFNFKGFIANDNKYSESVSYCDAPLISSTDDYVPQKCDAFACAIGSCESKERVVEIYSKNNSDFINIIHKSVIFFKNIQLGVGVIISPNCVLSNNCKIGNHVSLNLCTTIGHDVTIGNNCVINSHCDITGDVVVGDNVFMGSHVTILPGIKIANGIKIGAGSVVTKNIYKKGTYFGNPAKRIF